MCYCIKMYGIKKKTFFYSDAKLKKCFGGQGIFFCFFWSFGCQLMMFCYKFFHLFIFDQLELRKKNASYFFSLENYLKD